MDPLRSLSNRGTGCGDELVVPVGYCGDRASSQGPVACSLLLLGGSESCEPKSNRSPSFHSLLSPAGWFTAWRSLHLLKDCQVGSLVSSGLLYNAEALLASPTF